MSVSTTPTCEAKTQMCLSFSNADGSGDAGASHDVKTQMCLLLWNADGAGGVGASAGGPGAGSPRDHPCRARHDVDDRPRLLLGAGPSRWRIQKLSMSA